MSAGLPAPDPGAPVQDEAGTTTRSDVGNWARLSGRLSVSGPEAQAAGRGVTGRRLTGPMQGFGRLWQRTYTLDIGTVATPQQVISEWRAHFGEFWPRGSRFYGALEGINPGDVAPIAVGTGAGLKLSTGVVVLYADDESFSFMTPEGHMFAGMITFSGRQEGEDTIVQIQVLIRPNDPLYDLGMPLMRFMEDRFWSATMRNLARRLGSDAEAVDIVSVIVDRKRLWRNAGNVRYNAGIRSTLRLVAAPVVALRARVRAASGSARG